METQQINLMRYCLMMFMGVSITFAQVPKNMARINAGSYVPLYGTDDKLPLKVDAFLLDIYPVTNYEYLTFVKYNPAYGKSKIKRIFANVSYLTEWSNDLSFGKLDPQSPVTNISWFAAKKYCECQGKRLPTLDEWEYVGMADEKRIDARSKEDFNKYILSWYEKNNTYTNKVGQTYKNYWGIYDMNGLVWEWTYDFNSIFLSGESRKDKDTDSNLFCGSGSINATDLMNYAAFMRYAFRGSLKASYTTKNLGFRCAKSLK
ncbi:formylglycine-generating enzyme family protein [Flavobacterium tegetincola]|uniref:formylglycine-generating enzyme family protein n=1 Tax=Flavobacterium tegetincola TaxID=150172 RepID=UPI0012FC43EB